MPSTVTLTQQVFSYASGPSSGKSTYIRHACAGRECLLHEGFQLRELILESRKQIQQRQGRQVAIHIEAWRRYATEEFMRSMFPTAPELKLSLLYPVLKLVAMPRSHEVQNFQLLDGQEHSSLQGEWSKG
eukprot:s119_g69.t1